MNASEALNSLKSGEYLGVRTENSESIEIFWNAGDKCLEFERFNDPHVQLDEDEFLNQFRTTTFFPLEVQDLGGP